MSEDRENPTEFEVAQLRHHGARDQMIPQLCEGKLRMVPTSSAPAYGLLCFIFTDYLAAPKLQEDHIIDASKKQAFHQGSTSCIVHSRDFVKDSPREAPLPESGRE